MTGVRDKTQLRFSSNVAGVVANKTEQSFYSVYSYSGIESIEHALISINLKLEHHPPSIWRNPSPRDREEFDVRKCPGGREFEPKERREPSIWTNKEIISWFCLYKTVKLN